MRMMRPSPIKFSLFKNSTSERQSCDETKHIVTCKLNLFVGKS